MSSTDSSKVDVLVIGAGPSGLMLCTWLARLGITTRIVDKRFSAINSGQADGLQSRTFEIMDSLGIGQDLWREANHMLEIRFWNPDKDNRLYRSDTIVDTKPGLSRFQQATLHQARIEDYLLGYIKKHSSIKIERGIMPESLDIDMKLVDAQDEYPVSVTLRHLPPQSPDLNKAGDSNGASTPNGLFRSNLTADTVDSMLKAARESSHSHTELVRAKFVVGCDGAHSWTRRQIGSVMEGENTDCIWGVLDTIPITDFPDIRFRCAIQSASGSMMIIPRENKYVRMYIQLTEMKEGGQACVDRSKITQDNLFAAAKKILAPYNFSYKHCHWWTAYRIGQRVGSKFSAHERVFLAGDAVHTHSPKAGQGMNISMHDTYNLGWKIAYAVRGWADRSLLKTYVTERRQIAKELIEFDHRFARLFSGRPAKDIMDEEGINLETFKAVFEKGNLFSSGCAVDYASSIIVSKPQSSSRNGSDVQDEAEIAATTFHHAEEVVAKQHLATKIPIGQRIPSHKVLNQADARPWHLQELLPSNGAWRILVFAGDLQDPAQLKRYKALGEALSSPLSFASKSRLGKESLLESLIEILTIHSAPRAAVELLSLPEIFHPFSDEYGWDYNKVFVDDVSYHEGDGRAYENYGIDGRMGCVVIVRPDQYVSWIGDLEDSKEMERFFSGILRV
ncbi:probable FAD monooxygenase [Cephalotrichum gorgonifer]|uniref:Probable FAD monooxygenase n=1 Tax=Cephalotrichum gorgonifer TaxID=2041049 RepID=A0AAE8MZU3_9PEZI|nr:probable FAD monooxygenase [Cephalotrichum gorgonifer]